VDYPTNISGEVEIDRDVGVIVFPSSGDSTYYDLQGMPEKLVYWDAPAGSVTYMTMALPAGTAKLGVVHEGVQPPYDMTRGYSVRPRAGYWGKLAIAMPMGAYRLAGSDIVPHPWVRDVGNIYMGSTYSVNPIRGYGGANSGPNGWDYFSLNVYGTQDIQETYWASTMP